MREALMQIKNELGEDAVILKTRKLPKKMFNLGQSEEVEVTAAIDDTASQSALPPITMESTGVYARPRPSSNIIDTTQPGTPQIKPWEPPCIDESENNRTASIPRRSDDRRNQLEMMELRENIRELREMVKGILENGATVSAGGFTGGWAVVYKRLIDSEVKPHIAEELIRRAGVSDGTLSDKEAEKRFVNMISSTFPVAGPLKLKKKGPLVVAFVGPTGSGKTTTLAKLAAHCSITKKKNVSIITADTYRIAAIEQIRTFSDIIKVGLQVVFSSTEVPAALEACSGDDIVLIDTAGRSQRTRAHMEDLRAMMSAIGADEVHLVLSATTKEVDLLDCIERYRPLGTNRLLFSKLDETAIIGNVFNVIYQSGLPVSYLTTGQSVPDDIELAQTSRFMQRLFQGSAL